MKDKKIGKLNTRFEVNNRLASEISLMLVEARIVKGMTQERLANLAGTTQSSIARAENGTYLPSLRFLQKLAGVYGTTLISPKFAFLSGNIDENLVDPMVDFYKTCSFGIGDFTSTGSKPSTMADNDSKSSSLVSFERFTST